MTMKYLALATDYDGTIAHHGVVDPPTLAALAKFRESGRKLILVTGREISDLASTFSEPRIFDLIVGENGALLYYPATEEVKVLAKAPPPAFPDLLRERGVNQLSVGRVIVATQETYLGVVAEAIASLKLDLQIIPNKGSLMVLPQGVNKATGLQAALAELKIAPARTVGVGDAENDHSLLGMCGFAAAVSNALPELKAKAHYVTVADHGAGVAELIDKIMTEDRS
jgi:HAD superfamily hydrolase (TIGR01484 family)